MQWAITFPWTRASEDDHALLAIEKRAPLLKQRVIQNFGARQLRAGA